MKNSDLFLSNRFIQIEDQLWSKYQFHSGIDFIKDPLYKEVINMGKEIIPHLINSEHYFWFFALEEITGINPTDSKNNGNIRMLSFQWKEWWKRKERHDRINKILD